MHSECKISYYHEEKFYPVLEFYKTLSNDQLARIKKYRDLLEEKGHNLTLPQVKKLKGHNLWELRPSFWNTEIRILFIWKGNVAVFLHGFIKKGEGRKTSREYDIAAKRAKKLPK